jgi:hypothetical protein
MVPEEEGQPCVPHQVYTAESIRHMCTT